MERRNRNILVVCIAIVIVVAVFSSFGLGLFVGDTPHIVLPTPSASAQPGGDSPTDPGNGALVRVEVTPDTVQHIVEATLTRPDSYYREVTIEDFWGDGESGTTTAKVWTGDGWTRVEAAGPTGTVRSSLVGHGSFWIWYGDADSAVTGPADAYSADLEGQRIPTYEDVLSLDKALITDAGYEEKGGLPCIYVEVAENELGYRERYWVSVDTGLLVAAETADGDELLYRMSAYTLERPAPAGTLPSNGWTEINPDPVSEAGPA